MDDVGEEPDVEPVDNVDGELCDAGGAARPGGGGAAARLRAAEAAPIRARALVMLMLFTALRISETVALDVDARPLGTSSRSQPAPHLVSGRLLLSAEAVV